MDNIQNDDNMKIKLKKLEEIRNQRRRIHEENIFKDKKIALLSNNKINNITPILNSQNLNKSSTFPQIRNDQPTQPVYGQIPLYYNPYM